MKLETAGWPNCKRLKANGSTLWHTFSKEMALLSLGPAIVIRLLLVGRQATVGIDQLQSDITGVGPTSHHGVLAGESNLIGEVERVNQRLVLCDTCRAELTATGEMDVLVVNETTATRN